MGSLIRSQLAVSGAGRADGQRNELPQRPLMRRRKELCPHTASLRNRILSEDAPQESRSRERRQALRVRCLCSRGDPSRQKLNKQAVASSTRLPVASLAVWAHCALMWPQKGPEQLSSIGHTAIQEQSGSPLKELGMMRAEEGKTGDFGIVRFFCFVFCFSEAGSMMVNL